MGRECTQRVLLIVSALILLLPGLLLSQEGQPKPKEKKQTTRLTVEVAAVVEEVARPLKGAEVYVESETEGADFEPQTKKTDRNGVVSFSGVPRGKVKIQATAMGWSNFGDRFELSEERQTIRVQLKKEPEF